MSDKKQAMPLDNVVFYYTSIKDPKNKFESTEKEYSVTLALAKEDATAFGKLHPKQKPKAVENDEFMEKYKTELPFPNQSLQYLVTLKQSVNKADGTPMPETLRPRAFHQNTAGDIFDITETTLIGNGSRGKARYTVLSNNYGDFAKLKHILVTDLVEYSGGASNGDEWLEASKKTAQNAVKQVVSESFATPVSTAKTVDLDDDCPF
jgi:hypothetical protein